MSAELGFGLLAVLLVGIPALRVVTCHDLVRAILWLAATLLGTAVLYAMLHAPFLAGVQVLTYVGGVVTLMVFGVMVTRKHDGRSPSSSSSRAPSSGRTSRRWPRSRRRRRRTSRSRCSIATSSPSRSPRSSCWRPS